MVSNKIWGLSKYRKVNKINIDKILMFIHFEHRCKCSVLEEVRDSVCTYQVSMFYVEGLAVVSPKDDTSIISTSSYVLEYPALEEKTRFNIFH